MHIKHSVDHVQAPVTLTRPCATTDNPVTAHYQTLGFSVL